MSKPQPRELEVKSVETLSANMKRIVLGGEELAGFPEDSKSGYVKLQFDSSGQALTHATANPDQRPVMRSYTVRDVDVDQQRLVLDFAMHETAVTEPGPAARWAGNARVGDRILVGGPGPTKLIPQPADFYLLAGDMTALPAIAVNLEALPDDARGVAVIEVASEDDIQALDAPEGLRIEWVFDEHRGITQDLQADADSSVLVSAVRRQPWPEGEVSVWAACEFHKMKALRRYLRGERSIGNQNMYISSYWKLGRTDEQHKLDKRDDSEA